jgi:hypothetical protein
MRSAPCIAAGFGNALIQSTDFKVFDEFFIFSRANLVSYSAPQDES